MESEGRLSGRDGSELAWRRVQGAGPTVVWLGGFRSEMTGSKASALAHWAQQAGRDFLRFDYFGHGVSDGDFRQGTIGRWREDALTVVDALVEGPAVLVGSSMGGWIACLAALARPKLVRAMVLVAPAADFTEVLIEPLLPARVREAIETTGSWSRPSPYDPQGYPTTRELLEDGRRWSILKGPVDIERPVRILHGGRDGDVPWRHGQRLADAISSDDVVFTLVKDGDHSLSRPQDLKRLIATLEEVCA